MTHSVELRPSGRRFEVLAGQSVLDAALEAGLGVPFGCRNAICRACEARLLKGNITYPSGLPAALNVAESHAGKVLLCQARAASNLVIEAQESPAGVPRTLPCRVSAKTWLSHDVVELRLELRDGDWIVALPGQYVDLVLRDGRRRAFSLASPARPGGELELQLRVVPGGEFSSYAANHLKQRALLRVHGPLGAFYLRKSAGRPVILIAGGTGFAPIKAIIEDALSSGMTQPMHLYWGVRARRDLYLEELAKGWAAKHSQFRFSAVLSEPQAADEWTGAVGFVHRAVLADYPDLSGHTLYVSGPPRMVQAVRQEFPSHGLDPDQLFADSFDYAYVTGHDRAS